MLERISIAIAIIIFCLLMPPTYAAPISGASYLGLCSPHFPCNRALRVLRDRDVRALGYLAESFGTHCPCLDKFLRSPGNKYIRVHISNGTCFPQRGRRCGAGDTFENMSLAAAQMRAAHKSPRVMRRLRNKAKRVRSQLRKHDMTNVTLRVSPMLESPFLRHARRVLLASLSRIFPRETLVDSTTDKTCVKGYICELHGDEPHFPRNAECIADLDGVSMFEAQLDKYARSSRNCEAIFFWSHGFNLLPPGYSGKFILPSERTYQASKDEFGALNYCLSVDWYY